MWGRRGYRKRNPISYQEKVEPLPSSAFSAILPSYKRHWRFFDFKVMSTSHPSTERTLVIVKPDGVQRGLIGEVIKRYESVGLKLVGIKILVPTADKIEQHYTLDPEWRRITGEKTIESYRSKGMQPPSEDPQEITGVILQN